MILPAGFSAFKASIIAYASFIGLVALSVLGGWIHWEVKNGYYFE